MLPSKRGARRPRRKNGLSGGRIVGMRSIRERPEQAEGRRVPGHWEGDRATRSCTNLSGLIDRRGG